MPRPPPGITPGSPALAGGFFTAEPLKKPLVSKIALLRKSLKKKITCKCIRFRYKVKFFTAIRITCAAAHGVTKSWTQLGNQTATTRITQNFKFSRICERI